MHGDMWGLRALRTRWGSLLCYRLLSSSVRICPLCCELAAAACLMCAWCACCCTGDLICQRRSERMRKAAVKMQ